MSFSIGYSNGKLVVRSKAKVMWFGSVAVLAVLGFTLARDEPAKSQDELKREARRPPTVALQTRIELANKATVQFRQPTELVFKSFNELTLGTAKFKTSHAAELVLPPAFELLCYNGQSVGPTIRVRRGTTFHIRVRNTLPAGLAGAAHKADGDNEQPHDLCTTNLHTHGLHVSPHGNGDNIFQKIEPGEEFTYEFTIPADHPSGTHWYHPHWHGSVAYQLSNGLAGALIVEGTRDDGLADLEDVPEIAAAAERILVFQLYNYRVDPAVKDGVGRIDATLIYDVAPTARACRAIAVPDQVPAEKSQATAVNGVINPVMRLAPGEVQRWRLIHAAWDVNRRLYLADETGKPATNLQFHEIALDGIATGTMLAKGNAPDDPKAAPPVEIAPGQRSDVLLQAPQLRDGEAERVYYLRQSSQEQAGQPAAKENLILAKVVVGGAPRTMRLPDPRSLVKCQPFAAIRDEELATTNKSEIADKGLDFLATEGKIKRFWINKKTYSQFKSPVQIRLDTAEEWKVSAKAKDHPFHIHVNPFQVTMRTGANGNSQPVNVWRDTLLVRQGETYTIRSRFKDFLGKTVIHCHFLDHEDQGMMMPIEFIPPYQTPKTALASQGGMLKPSAARAPVLKLADPNGRLHELTEFRSRTVVLVLFQGLECGHCTEQLTKLLREAAVRLDVNTVVVAVSSRPIVDPAKAIQTLEAPAAGRFLLLVDEECRAFRTFGCYNKGPLHGLFLIDRTGVIRASYTGETPFADVRAVAEQAKLLAGARSASP